MHPPANDGQVSGNSSVGVHKGAYRARLNSHYLRELNHGNFIIKYEQLTLWENIGQGMYYYIIIDFELDVILLLPYY